MVARSMEKKASRVLLSLFPRGRLGIVLSIVPALVICLSGWGQSTRVPPRRAKPPQLQESDFQGIFFADVKAQLFGERPSPQSGAGVMAQGGNAMGGSASLPASGANASTAGDSIGSAWSTHISAESIEAFVKGSRSKLDQLVTTPAKFADGSYKDCRREFELLAIMFLTIERFDGDVRWKSSAAVARERFSKAAAASKVGSQQAYQEAKGALQDLVDLLNRGQIEGTVDEQDVDWGSAINRSLVMQMMENSLREVLLRNTSNANEFGSNQEKLVQHAEFLALIGDILQLEGMPEADEKEYRELCQAMTEMASELTDAVKQSNLDRARSSLGAIDQTCTKCHDSYK